MKCHWQCPRGYPPPCSNKHKKCKCEAKAWDPIGRHQLHRYLPLQSCQASRRAAPAGKQMASESFALQICKSKTNVWGTVGFWECKGGWTCQAIFTYSTWRQSASDLAERHDAFTNQSECQKWLKPISHAGFFWTGVNYLNTTETLFAVGGHSVGLNGWRMWRGAKEIGVLPYSNRHLSLQRPLQNGYAEYNRADTFLPIKAMNQSPLQIPIVNCSLHQPGEQGIENVTVHLDYTSWIWIWYKLSRHNSILTAYMHSSWIFLNCAPYINDRLSDL